VGRRISQAAVRGTVEGVGPVPQLLCARMAAAGQREARDTDRVADNVG